MLQHPQQRWRLGRSARARATSPPTMVSTFAMSWMETVGRPKVYCAVGRRQRALELRRLLPHHRRRGHRAPTCTSRSTRARPTWARRPTTGSRCAPAPTAPWPWPGRTSSSRTALIDELYTEEVDERPVPGVRGHRAERLPGEPGTTAPTTTSRPACSRSPTSSRAALPTSSLCTTTTGRPSKADGIEHQYGEFTWFNADQEGVIDNTGGFWEGENYDSMRAREGKEANQANLLKGQTQGHVPDPMPFDPAIDPALTGEFEIELKDGKKHKVRPVWEYYRERAAEFSPEIAAEDHRHPRRGDRRRGHGLWHPHRPGDRLRQRRHPVHARHRARLQRHPELPRPRQPHGHHGQHRHPRRQPLHHHRPDRRRPAGLRRLGPRRFSAGSRGQRQAARPRALPGARLVGQLVPT